MELHPIIDHNTTTVPLIDKLEQTTNETTAFPQIRLRVVNGNNKYEILAVRADIANFTK